MKRFLLVALFALISGMAAAQEAPPADITAVAKFKNREDCTPKEYPTLARFYEQQGAVLLYFLVDVDGKVLDSKIGQSSGFPILDEAALAAFTAPACQFDPILADGKPVKSWARIRYNWKLTGNRPPPVDTTADNGRPALPLTADENVSTFYKAPQNEAAMPAKLRNPASCVPKEYPATARFYEQQGTVVLHFLLDVDGKMLAAKVGQSSGWPLLDEAALAAFSAPTCEFQPILANGQPIKTWARIKYTWKLN